MSFQIKSESSIVNMNDVKNIYADKCEFKNLVSSINNILIPELERLARSNVVRYGDVGTGPLFDKLIEEVREVVKDLNAYADNRINDFQIIHDAEVSEYRRYKQVQSYMGQVSNNYPRTTPPQNTVSRGDE